MPPVKVFNFTSLYLKSGRVWFVCRSRQQLAAFRITIAEVPNALGRTFAKRLNRFFILLINNCSEKVFYLICIRDSFLTDMASDTANLAVLAHHGTLIVTVAKHVNL